MPNLICAHPTQIQRILNRNMRIRIIPYNIHSKHPLIRNHRFRDSATLGSGRVVPSNAFWEEGLVVVGDHGVEVKVWCYYYASDCVMAVGDCVGVGVGDVYVEFPDSIS